MVKPLIPIVCDAWSHEFNGLEHISLVHAKFGNNHLEKELAEKAGDENHGKNQSTLKVNDQVPFHVSPNAPTGLCPLNNTALRYFGSYSAQLPLAYILYESPPPKFS